MSQLQPAVGTKTESRDQTAKKRLLAPALCKANTTPPSVVLVHLSCCEFAHEFIIACGVLVTFVTTMSGKLRKLVKNKSRRKHTEMMRRQRASDDRRARELLAGAAKRKLPPSRDRSPPAKRQALRSEWSDEDDESEQYHVAVRHNMVNVGANDTMMQKTEAEDHDEEDELEELEDLEALYDEEEEEEELEDLQAMDEEEEDLEKLAKMEEHDDVHIQQDVLDDDDVDIFQFTSLSDDDFDECGDVSTLIKPPLPDTDGAFVRRAVSRFQVADDVSDNDIPGDDDSGERGEPSAVRVLHDMVEDDERNVASRATTRACEKKATVPSAAVRIADVGIVRLPEHGRSGRLMKHLKPYPGVATSTCWITVQNWTRYVHNNVTIMMRGLSYNKSEMPITALFLEYGNMMEQLCVTLHNFFKQVPTSTSNAVAMVTTLTTRNMTLVMKFHKRCENLRCLLHFARRRVEGERIVSCTSRYVSFSVLFSLFCFCFIVFSLPLSSYLSRVSRVSLLLSFFFFSLSLCLPSLSLSISLCACALTSNLLECFSLHGI